MGTKAKTVDDAPTLGSAVLFCRVSGAFHDQIRGLAKRKGRTLSGQVRWMLERCLALQES